jgi:hypothetical protein
MKPKKNAFKTISPLYMALDMGYMMLYVKFGGHPSLEDGTSIFGARR